MISVDGSRYSGSGTIVRQAVMYAALTGQPVHITQARIHRPNPGLRPQHLQVIAAISALVNGTTEGVSLGSHELVFRPGVAGHAQQYVWDIGSAGSATMLALALLPVLVLRPVPTLVELRGGLFQDFAPSFFHLEQVVLPLLRRMGVAAEISLDRPGYVPLGAGILRLVTRPLCGPLQPLVLDQPGPVQRMWGVALSSRLEQRQVSHRMADAANAVLAPAGYQATIAVQYDTTAAQAGAALALCADLEGGGRLGADRAGAPRRSSEAIGRYAAHHLLEDLGANATVDRYAADQLIPFAALAQGESRLRIPRITDHVQTSGWLAQEFLGARVTITDHLLVIAGAGFRPSAAPTGALPESDATSQP